MVRGWKVNSKDTDGFGTRIWFPSRAVIWMFGTLSSGKHFSNTVGHQPKVKENLYGNDSIMITYSFRFIVGYFSVSAKNQALKKYYKYEYSTNIYNISFFL